MSKDVIKMKKFNFLFLLVLCAVFFSSCGIQKVSNEPEEKITPPKSISEWDAILKQNQMTVGINRTEFAELFVEALGKESGLQLEVIEYASFEDAKKAVENKEVQMYVGNFPKESRDTIDFSVSSPYLKSTSDIIALSEDYKPDKDNDTAGVIRESTEMFLVDNYFNNYVVYDNIHQLFSALVNKKISCAFIDTLLFEKSGYSKNEYFVFDTYPYSLVAVYNQKSTEVAREMEVWIAKLKASGEADDISEKCFGENLIFK